MSIIEYFRYGIIFLITSFPISLILFSLIFITQYFINKKLKTNFKTYLLEFILCLYIITVFEITGIIGYDFKLSNIHNGFTQMNLIPFIGASFKMLILNFLLFTPYGVLVSIVFNKRSWNLKRIFSLALISSFIIEISQIFTGRFVELDDIIMNSLGTLLGYLLFISLKKCFTKDLKIKGIIQSLSVILSCFICFYGISLLCRTDVYKPDGFKAVDSSNIKEINIYKNGTLETITDPDWIYSKVSNTLSNCGGHILNINDIRKTKTQIMDNHHVYIQILFNEPENITFTNSSDLVLNETSHILYDVNDYMLYWGTHDNLLHSVYYMELEPELQEHEGDVRNQLDTIACE